LINTPNVNEYKINNDKKVRSQIATYVYYLKKLEN
jgi:polyphosphate kinase